MFIYNFKMYLSLNLQAKVTFENVSGFASNAINEQVLGTYLTSSILFSYTSERKAICLGLNEERESTPRRLSFI